MKTELAMYEYTCDACGKTLYNPVGEGIVDVYGYHGHVMHVHTSGGDTADWYACQLKCINKAIINALNRDDRE